jgi:hypothetical protein
VPQVGHLPELYEDARSEKYKKQSYEFNQNDYFLPPGMVKVNASI